MKFIWATRGRTWGFRFVHRAGFDDPLPAYSAAFSGFEGVRQLLHRAGTTVALRFDDPLGRTDLVGRVIPHEFVIVDGFPPEITSVAGGMATVWPLVETEYARDYHLPDPELHE